MPPYDLLDWLIDFLVCFSVVIFMLLFKIIILLCVTKNKFSMKELSLQLKSLVNDGQAALLVIAYDIMTIRNILNMNFIRYFRNMLIVFLVIFIIYSIVIYVLVKEVEYFKNEKMVINISLLILAFSVLGSLIYTVVQLSV